MHHERRFYKIHDIDKILCINVKQLIFIFCSYMYNYLTSFGINFLQLDLPHS